MPRDTTKAKKKVVELISSGKVPVETARRMKISQASAQQGAFGGTLKAGQKALGFFKAIIATGKKSVRLEGQKFDNQAVGQKKAKGKFS